MPTKKSPLDSLRAHRLMPLVEIRDASTAPELAATFVRAGLPILEIGLRTDAAIGALRGAAREKGDLLLAAGTVASAEQVRLAVDAGADLIVTPGVNALVIEYCLKNSIPIVPGVCTPTEIETARNYGLTTLKFFPAEAFGGVRTLRALGEAYRGVAFVPTGGINLQNLGEYLKLPTVVACGGSWMASAETIQCGRFDLVLQAVQQAIACVSGVGSNTARK
jgi:2-dehydro-3-deoxyphosphogluconate aldolase/(4S)-4-hydroxy-2-oxoglutarate aldolase